MKIRIHFFFGGGGFFSRSLCIFELPRLDFLRRSLIFRQKETFTGEGAQPFRGGTTLQRGGGGGGGHKVSAVLNKHVGLV